MNLKIPVFHDKYYILVIFLTGCLVRGIPELLAYPYPSGYDVINYYIPELTFFDTQWPTILRQFPVYVFLLHLINISSGLIPYQTVIAVSTGVFGIFAVSLFYVGRKILDLTAIESTFLSIFVIFQIAVLRISLDLHRDMFALSIVLLSYVLLYKRTKNNLSFQMLIIAMVFSVTIVLTDGMIGILFILSLIIYSIIARTKIVILCTIVAIIFFTIAILPAENNLHYIIRLNLTSQTETGRTYSNYYMTSTIEPMYLAILFFLFNGLLLPTGVIGIYKAIIKEKKRLILALPLVICFVLSISWILFPKNTTLVAQRWIILFGLFLSIFAAYGIVRIINNAKSISANKRIMILGLVLGTFIIIGTIYATWPANPSFAIINPFTGLPVGTMQPDKESINNLITLISWINNNTNEDSIIIGAKNFRGYMNLTLDAKRDWMDFGLKQYTAEEFFNVFDKFLVDHKQFNYIADHEDTYVVTPRTQLEAYFSDNLNYTKVYSGEYNIYKLNRVD